MVALSHIPKRPLCLSCLQGIMREDIFLLLASTQLRGKKTSTKKGASTIKVRLLKDMPGFGRKGSITPVAPGRMRNSWYPRQHAEYLSTIEGLKPKSVVAERDFMFGVQRQQEAPKETKQVEEGVVETRTKLLPPQKAMEILAATLPKEMVFYRNPITNPEPETSADQTLPQERRLTGDAAAALAAPSAPTAKVQGLRLINIFGSVTTADMADAIKAILAEYEDGGRVVIGAEDISIVGAVPGSGIEGDRLKALGDFMIDIRVKGGEAVGRIVSVRAQEAGLSGQ